MANEVETDTHSAIVTGTGGTTAADAAIGSITLPAGGPWTIFGAFAQVVSATATAAESLGGYFFFNPASGDLTPDPSPSHFPVFETGSSLGGTIDRGSCPLNIFPVDWNGAGKAVINAVYHNSIAPTVAPQVVMGLMFGKTVPEALPLTFCDSVQTTVTSASDTSIGTITLAEKASQIVGVCGILNQDGVLVAGEELIGFFRLASDDIKLPPMQLPFNNVFGAGLGATIAGGSQGPINFIPVNIPVIGGARVNCYVDLNTAVTNGANVEVYIAYK